MKPAIFQWTTPIFKTDVMDPRLPIPWRRLVVRATDQRSLCVENFGSGLSERFRMAHGNAIHVWNVYIYNIYIYYYMYNIYIIIYMSIFNTCCITTGKTWKGRRCLIKMLIFEFPVLVYFI